MNVFFYSRKSVDCLSGCVYYTCSKRCLTLLKKFPVLQNLEVLPEVLYLSSGLKRMPRSGDLVILYVGSWYELEELLAMVDMFEPYRIVLVLGSRDFESDHRYHRLKPRYVATMDTNLSSLEGVVTNMCNSVYA